jgi:hypothetical protein
LRLVLLVLELLDVDLEVDLEVERAPDERTPFADDSSDKHAKSRNNESNM